MHYAIGMAAAKTQENVFVLVFLVDASVVFVLDNENIPLTIYIVMASQGPYDCQNSRL